jgi:hypothetical protein
MEHETIIDVSVGEEKEQTHVRLRLHAFGKDFILLIGGGQEHIGSVACTNKLKGYEFMQHTLLLHKEDVLVKTALLKLEELLPGELLVIGGIHYDNIDKEKIAAIVKNCDQLIVKAAEELKVIFAGKI